MSDPARKTMLKAIRDQLDISRARGEVVPPLPPIDPAASAEHDVDALVAGFRARAEPLGVRIVVESTADLVETVQARLTHHGAATLAVVDAESDLAQGLAGRGVALCPADRPDRRDELWQVDAGLTSARLAIAESGTLVLDSRHEASRLTSLLPPLHLAVVPISRLVDTLATALSELGGADIQDLADCVTFITGPSRTADIELKLVVGVHGPKTLEVIFVSDA